MLDCACFFSLAFWSDKVLKCGLPSACRESGFDTSPEEVEISLYIISLQ